MANGPGGRPRSRPVPGWLTATLVIGGILATVAWFLEGSPLFSTSLMHALDLAAYERPPYADLRLASLVAIFALPVLLSTMLVLIDLRRGKERWQVVALWGVTLAYTFGIVVRLLGGRNRPVLLADIVRSSDLSFLAAERLQDAALPALLAFVASLVVAKLAMDFKGDFRTAGPLIHLVVGFGGTVLVAWLTLR